MDQGQILPVKFVKYRDYNYTDLEFSGRKLHRIAKYNMKFRAISSVTFTGNKRNIFLLTAGQYM